MSSRIAAALVLALLTTTTALGAVAFGSAPSTAAEDASSYMPDHARCVFDQDRLERYEPELRRSHLSVQPTAVHGAAFVSSERDTDYLVYWARYTHQQGVSAEDSHFGDHEPIYVEVNDDTGEIVSIQYSAYHYLKGDLQRPAAEPFLNGTHVRMRVARPWHHYTPEKRPGGFAELRNFCDSVQPWYNNGWEASPEAVMNPWTMSTYDRRSWWKDNTLGFSGTEYYWRVQRQIADALSWAWGF